MINTEWFAKIVITLICVSGLVSCHYLDKIYPVVK